MTNMAPQSSPAGPEYLTMRGRQDIVNAELTFHSHQQKIIPNKFRNAPLKHVDGWFARRSTTSLPCRATGTAPNNPRCAY